MPRSEGHEHIQTISDSRMNNAIALRNARSIENYIFQGQIVHDNNIDDVEGGNTQFELKLTQPSKRHQIDEWTMP